MSDAIGGVIARRRRRLVALHVPVVVRGADDARIRSFVDAEQRPRVGLGAAGERVDVAHPADALRPRKALLLAQRRREGAEPVRCR